MSDRIAFITGITGQDGSYLAELLLSKGYEVHGLIRRASSFNTGRIDHVYQDPHHKGQKLHLHYGDLTDAGNLQNLLTRIKPNEVYNLGAQSHVRVSFDMPVYTVDTVAMGPVKLLEAIRVHQDESGEQIRFYQASSSEMFGLVQEVPQRETTPFYPRSPYGCAKVFGHWITVNYRESYDMHASCGILFNHESPRRGETFVTRKITRAVGRIKLGLQDKLFLGNLDAQRDWGFAGDYVHGMWLMMQHDVPDDWVLATGESHTVEDFLKLAFGKVNLNWEDFVTTDKKYERPNEVSFLLGDSSKAQKNLGWELKTSFSDLVEIMVESDIEIAKQEKVLLENKSEILSILK